MQRVAILVDGWNLLKAADRLKRRVNLAELAHAAPAHSPNRYSAFRGPSESARQASPTLYALRTPAVAVGPLPTTPGQWRRCWRSPWIMT
jgi:hypothetical protein